MGYQTMEITCRGCGAPLAIGDKECKFCHGPVNITTIQSVYDMTSSQVNQYANSYRNDLRQNSDNTEANKSLALCYMKLKLYDKAIPFLEKAVENNFDDVDLYLYMAICILHRKRPFLQQKKTIDQAIEYMDSACMLQNKGIYHYFTAYLKYDFYYMKKLKINPSYMEELAIARQAGLSEADIKILFDLTGTDRPSGF